MNLIKLRIGMYEESKEYILDIKNYTIDQIKSAIEKGVEHLCLSKGFLVRLDSGYYSDIEGCCEEINIRILGERLSTFEDIIKFILNLEEVSVEFLDLDILRLYETY